MLPFVIAAIEDPDYRAFMENVYKSYNRLICSEIRKYLKNDWDVEDVMQSVLVKLIGKVSGLREFDREQRINYIIVATRNTALNYIRDNKKVTQFSFDEDNDWLADKYPAPDDQLERIELAEDVRNAWRALDKRSRNILEMKYVLEKSDKEIGAELGVAANSVRMLLSRARGRLRKNMLAEEVP